jgi:hypothetical protein
MARRFAVARAHKDQGETSRSTARDLQNKQWRAHEMAVIDHGIDIVEVARIEKLLADPERDFLEGAFSPPEQEFAPAPETRAEHFAGLLAAKKAVVKALGTGFSQGIAGAKSKSAAGTPGRLPWSSPAGRGTSPPSWA